MSGQEGGRTRGRTAERMDGELTVAGWHAFWQEGGRESDREQAELFAGERWRADERADGRVGGREAG